MAFIMPILRVGKLKLKVKELVRDRTARKSSWAQTRPVLRITAPHGLWLRRGSRPGAAQAWVAGTPHSVGSVAQAGLGAAGV